jgi:23S rRNA pseudouridine1911/1915/1917 synthase
MGDVRNLVVPPESAGRRLDQFLAEELAPVSRSRIHFLLARGEISLNGAPPKPSLKLRGGERIVIPADPRPERLEAVAEAIPLDVIYEDPDLAVVNKPAGMMVHAGAGAPGDARSKGTLVNALLHRFEALSSSGGNLRPGIVHRLDKETSGLLLVAKNDAAHAALASLFSGRSIRKTYVALVHGEVSPSKGTIRAPIGRDPVRRTRMTARPTENGRSAVSHYEVMRRISSRFGTFSLVRVVIETGRTHQIRVHMSSIGHPVVGDTLYGAAGRLTEPSKKKLPNGRSHPGLRLGRNFLHAARIEFVHPVSGRQLELEAPLPAELDEFLIRLEGAS